MALGFLVVAAIVTGCLPRASSVIYVPYIMEDACDGLPRTVQLPPTGPGSAIIMRSHQGAHYKSGLTCNFIVKTSSDYRIVVVFETIQFPGTTRNCSDSLLLSNAEQVDGPICTSDVKEVVSRGNVMNVTWSTGGGEPASNNDGFEAIVTAYKPGTTFCTFSQFKCANHRCVADNFACDGHNNCGDNSDEKCDFGTSFWRSFGSMSVMMIAVLVMGVCMVMPLVARACFGSPEAQQQQSRPNTPMRPERADEDKPSSSSTGEKCTETATTEPTASDSQYGVDRKPGRGDDSAKVPASSPASSPNRDTKVNATKPTERALHPGLQRGGRRRRRRQMPLRSSSRQRLLSPAMLGEPLSTSTYRCILLPPGKTLSSEISQRSPLYHVYDAANAPAAAAGQVKSDSSCPKKPMSRGGNVPNKGSVSPRSPAPEATTTTMSSSFHKLHSRKVVERPATPALYVLRSRSNLSQDNNVECGIREVSCGLERGPVFTPIQPSAFCTAVRRSVTPASVHRTPRPQCRESSRRAASSSPATRSGSVAKLPGSRSPSREGVDNQAYSSD